MNEKIRRAKYKGELDLAGFKLPCYVLEDGTRVLSNLGMQDAFKMTDEDDKQKSGSRLGRHLSQKSLQPFIYKEKSPGHYDPFVFYYGNQKINGNEATRLVDFGDGMLEARNHIELSPRQKIIADQAEIIIRSVAKVGIIALVDEVTGYQKVREKTLQEILKLYISEEILKWQKTFHDGFYEQIFRLWNIPFSPKGIKKRPAFIGTLTNKLVYENLPEGVLEKIKEKIPKTKGDNYRYRFHQSLTPEVGKEELKKVINSVETLASISQTKEEFLKLMDKYRLQKKLPAIDQKIIDEKELIQADFDKKFEALLSVPFTKEDE
jgi:hypothetical protein